MQIVIVSGFLGSGKTTSVIWMGKHFKSKGYRVAVLVNDIGDVGVDGQFIARNRLESKEMPRGCICCTLRYALEANVSVTSYQDKPEVELVGSGADDAGKFTVFAAVTDVARDNLADIIEEAVLSRSGQLGISA
ncbi:MAG: GTP-binding protein [Methanolobus sp.]|nr:GTP-binding protein [Methanolobus sp.]